MPSSLLVEFTKDKETKGAVRYAEVLTEETGDRGAIGTFYLRKDVAEGLGSPERLLVKVEAA